ncbi:MAG: hypothetical protein WBB07_01155 [Mycobacterium sp.]
MAAFGLLGCSSDGPPAPSAPPPPRSAESAQQPAQLPQPAALLDVLNRLSDPGVPGVDKLDLIEGATAREATALDAFTTALRDNQLAPLEYGVTGIRWSADQPGFVVADVTATPADPAAAPFSYPMEFRASSSSWQLSQQTADLLLALGG